MRLLGGLGEEKIVRKSAALPRHVARAEQLLMVTFTQTNTPPTEQVQL